MLVLALGLSSCAGPTPPQTRPDGRAPELDLLDAWVGEWNTTSETRLPGETTPMQSHGHESVAWKCNKQFLLEEMTWTEGDVRQGAMAVRTWDPHAKLFRSWYFDSHGMVGHSKMTYDPADRTWTVHTRSADPETCMPTVGEMTIRQPEPTRMEWHFTEFDRQTHKKRVEMTGLSRRE